MLFGLFAATKIGGPKSVALQLVIESFSGKFQAPGDRDNVTAPVLEGFEDQLAFVPCQTLGESIARWRLRRRLGLFQARQNTLGEVSQFSNIAGPIMIQQATTSGG